MTHAPLPAPQTPDPLAIVSQLVCPPEPVMVRDPSSRVRMFAGAGARADLILRELLGGVPLRVTVQLADGVHLTCNPTWIAPIGLRLVSSRP